MHTLFDAQSLALRYAQIVDNREFEAMREILGEGFSQQGPQWHCEGADAFIELLQTLPQRFSATFHLVGNQIGAWQGERYQGETYCIASHLYEQDGQGRKLDMAIRYQEQVECIERRYCYTRRDVHVIWTSDRSLNR